MKPQRLVYSPTRSRRLNEMLGLIVLVAGGLLLLSLVSYTPSDPSFNTVAGDPGAHPAHNWTGLVGAYTSDLLLQTLGVAILFLPLTVLRLGVSWMRSRRFGSAWAKCVGLALWLTFAPAAIALLPGSLLWRHAIPIAGIEGRILADGLIHFVNFPGAAILCGLMVALSLYLSTTFLLTSSSEWFLLHFGFLRNLSERFAAWKARRNGSFVATPDTRREQAALRNEKKAADEDEPGNTSLLGSLFGWFGRRRAPQAEDNHPGSVLGLNEEPAASVWQNIPRTVVDSAPVTGLHAAAAAAAPFAAQLAAAAAPLQLNPENNALFADRDTVRTAYDDDDWLNAPERQAPAPILSPPKSSHVPLPEPPPARLPVAPAAPAQSSAQAAAEPVQSIAFGKRADADLRAVAITAKSVRGYKLPPSRCSSSPKSMRRCAKRRCAKRRACWWRSAPSSASTGR